MNRTLRAEVTQIYQRGRRLVFAPKIVEGAKPTSAKKRSSPQHEAHLYDEEPIHFDTNMEKLEVNEEHI